MKIIEELKQCRLLLVGSVQYRRETKEQKLLRIGWQVSNCPIIKKIKGILWIGTDFPVKLSCFRL